MVGLLTKALRDLFQRPIRSLLTVLGIAAGVAGLVAISSTSHNLERAQRELYANTSQADIVYWVWDAPTGLISLLESNPKIHTAELRSRYVTRWKGDERWMDIELVGLKDFGQSRINQFDLLEGTYPELGEIVLEVSAARPLGLTIGSEILYRDRHGRERRLTVSGLSRSPSYLSTSITKLAVGYVPMALLSRLLDVSGSNQLLVKLHDPTEAQQVAEWISSLLRRQGLQAAAPDVRNPGQFVGKRELDALVTIMFLFSTLGLTLSGFLVINTLAASITEQINEIGILKTLGATRPQILLLYVLEACIYGLVGTTLGIALGALAGWRLLAWIGELGNARIGFRLAPEGLVLGSLVGVGISVLGGLIPAARGARATIKDTLESYGIEANYGQGWLDRQLRVLRRLPPLAAMALRNLARRKGRTALTLFVVALSTAAFLGATATRDSVNAAIDDIYRTYDADAWVWFEASVSTEFEELLPTVDGVDGAEGWLIANGIVKLTEARLWGLPATSRLYREVMREGRWLRPDEPDAMVISTELADDQSIEVGDLVEVQYQDQRRSLAVVGIAVDNTIFLGGTLAGKAFLPRSTLGRLMGLDNRTSLYALDLRGREPAIADPILSDIEQKFQRWRPTVQPVYVEIESAQEASRLLTLALVAMVIIVTLVGALGILNTLTLNVLERRREIAVMRSMGGTNMGLTIVFVVEGLGLGTLGWLIGMALGWPAAQILVRQMSRVLFSLEFRLSPRAVLLSALFTFGLASVSSLGPALGVSHTPVSAALRYE